MKPVAARGRRITIFCALTGLAVLAIVGFLERTWIHDHWLLHRLPGMPRDQQWRAIVGLVERQRPGVTPHLLRYLAEHPFEGSMGMGMAAHNHAVGQIVAIGPGAVPHLARAVDAGKFDSWLVFDALSTFGTASKPALPAMIRHLELSKKSTQVLELLLSSLGRDRESKLGAVECLEWLHERAAPALPSLEALAGDPDPELAGRARGAIRSIRAFLAQAARARGGGGVR